MTREQVRQICLERISRRIADYGAAWWQRPEQKDDYRRYISEPLRLNVWSMEEAALLSKGEVERVRVRR